MSRFLTHYANLHALRGPGDADVYGVTRASTAPRPSPPALALTAAAAGLLIDAVPDFSHPLCAACDGIEELLYARTIAAVLRNLDQARPGAVPAPLLNESLAREESAGAPPARRDREGRRDPARGVAGSSG
ncbi:hypothetical protein DL767_003392 [Monosporascus sp. MG133]|nr:hypothetical protein DL767_003392 [Monosporascus sp. MG133]